jgi:beta-lactam-binding protein with PASTA domain
VPDVLGLRQEEARQRLEAAGLRVGIVTRRPERRPPGLVVQQQPGAGVLSPHEGRVNLVISN